MQKGIPFLQGTGVPRKGIRMMQISQDDSF
jgi:hypothetical protein